MRNYSAKTVSQYIAGAPRSEQAKLREVRAAVKAAVPGAQESISWGVPFYRYHGLLAGFSAGKSHILFGLVAALDAEDDKAFRKSGYETGKKTVRIRYDQKVPAAAIKRMLKARAKANIAKEKAK